VFTQVADYLELYHNIIFYAEGQFTPFTVRGVKKFSKSFPRVGASNGSAGRAGSIASLSTAHCEPAAAGSCGGLVNFSGIAFHSMRIFYIFILSLLFGGTARAVGGPEPDSAVVKERKAI